MALGAPVSNGQKGSGPVRTEVSARGEREGSPHVSGVVDAGAAARGARSEATSRGTHDPAFATLAIHAEGRRRVLDGGVDEGLAGEAGAGLGQEVRASSVPILTPICQSTTYVQARVGAPVEHTYSRASNPTVSALERVLGAIEQAPPAVAFGTGMAAITGLVLSAVKSGEHVVVSDVVYGGTVRLLQQILAPLGITSSFVDATDPAQVGAALTARTRLVLIETPGNPTLKLNDVAAIAAVVREHEGRTGGRVIVAVDNTFLTPAILRPLDLGADVSVYSTTKYIEGHNSTVGGSLTTHDEALLKRFRLVRKSIGSIQSPFEAWLTLRGLKTLELRIRRHSESAQRVAEFLERHPRVRNVRYPGLASFPQRELAERQHRTGGLGGAGGAALHGGIIGFEVAGAARGRTGAGGSSGLEAGIRVMNSVRLCSLAENLGAAETLITHPVSMTHGDVPREQRLAAGITDEFIRLSVGLEAPEDIIADLDQALGQLE